MERTQHAPLIEQAKEKTRKRIRDDKEGAPEEVAEILGLIAQGIFRPRFDINDVRRECAPNAETLRAFRAHVGGTFKSYLTERLLETAKPLVDEPDVDVAAIASELGFASADLFSRWFRRWTGRTPDERRSALPPSRSAAPAADPLIAAWFRARLVALKCGEPALLSQAVRFIRARRANP